MNARPFKVLVCGGRDFCEPVRLIEVLDTLEAEHGRLLVIAGGAKGADAISRAWAYNGPRHAATVKANWTAFHAGAGPIRNEIMLSLDPDLVIAFPTAKSKGTWHMVNAAREAGVPVSVYEPRD